MSIGGVTAYMTIGVMAGVMAGFFGIGGGLVIIPMLVLVMGFTQYAANGTSLVALLGPVGLMGVIAYYQAGKLSVENIKAGLLIALGIFIGTYFGSKIALQMSSGNLRRGFCIFLVLVAIRMWMQTSSR